VCVGAAGLILHALPPPQFEAEETASGASSLDSVSSFHALPVQQPTTPTQPIQPPLRTSLTSSSSRGTDPTDLVPLPDDNDMPENNASGSFDLSPPHNSQVPDADDSRVLAHSVRSEMSTPGSASGYRSTASVAIADSRIGQNESVSSIISPLQSMSPSSHGYDDDDFADHDDAGGEGGGPLALLPEVMNDASGSGTGSKPPSPIVCISVPLLPVEATAADSVAPGRSGVTWQRSIAAVTAFRRGKPSFGDDQF
jgi:hypothetical protein